jgi:hypothetical protein
VGCIGILLCAAWLGGCGSSGPSASASALTEQCQHVSAVLSDGPDPGSDPIGYAQAQILPLHRIHVSDAALQAAVDRLDTAYHQLFITDGSSSAKQAVARGSDRLNAICPGAAP